MDRCHYCHSIATTKDHIVPKALGGANHSKDIVPACRPCNVEKANKMPTCGCPKCREAVRLFGPEGRLNRFSLAKTQVTTPDAQRARSRADRKMSEWLNELTNQ